MKTNILSSAVHPELQATVHDVVPVTGFLLSHQTNLRIFAYGNTWYMVIL